jgi:hypothetical protein
MGFLPVGREGTPRDGPGGAPPMARLLPVRRQKSAISVAEFAQGWQLTSRGARSSPE